MAHLHLALELGGGLGRAGRLGVLARALLAHGHHVSLSLRDLGATQHLLADLSAPRFQSPVWQGRMGGMPPNEASLGEILLPQGYFEVAGLCGLVQGWRATLTAVGADLVVADYAPTALLAARSLGLPAVALGGGFACPPAARALPCLRDWEQIAPQRLARAEAHVLNVANAVLEHHGAAALPCAAALLLGDDALLTTWPELDPHGRTDPALDWHGPIWHDAGATAPPWPAGDGPPVFAYLKHEHPSQAEVLTALVEAGCRVLCHMPETMPGRPPPVIDPAIAYVSHPVSLGAVLADAALCVCHGGEATLTQALLAGVPTLMLPMRLEQFLLARRVEGWGGGINGARVLGDWAPALHALLGDGRWRAAAQAFAGRHAGTTVEERVARVVRRLELRLG
jgi:UDP:flavonoid glycosyltransferase YjiC (YdhE family)